MSLINKVLRDLDRRQPAAPTTSAQVRAVAPRTGGDEWFWRLISFLTLLALGWVGWVVYQVQPRPLATELAQKAAERPEKGTPVEVATAPTPAVPPVVQKPAAEAPPTPMPAQQPAPMAQKTAPQSASATAPDKLRFAYSIETPISVPAPKPEPAKAEVEKPKAEPAKPKVEAPKPQAEPKKKAVAEKSRVERRDVALNPADRAENEFRRGVDLLKRGRANEAEAAFTAALRFDPRNRGARQALVALKLERGELDEAGRLLEETLAADPAQVDFAVALARIHVERNRPLFALTALDGAAAGAGNHAEYHFMRGTVLQRLGRHAEAADAYRAALRVQATLPQAWMGLGISLEALAQRKAAADAFRSGLAAGPVSSELRTFAEQRIQALR